MSEHSSQPPLDPRLAEQLETYLDGQLSGDAKSRFESALAEHPSLRAQVEQQHAIDQSLQRMFVAPQTSAELNARLLQQSNPLRADSGNGRARPARDESIRLPRVRRSLLVAASTALLIGVPLVGYNAWEYFSASRTTVTQQYKSRPPRPLDVAYREEVAAGFKCDWECDEAQFATTFAARLGQPMLMRALPAEVAQLGLMEGGGITDHSVVYLARVSGKPVMVFADRVDADAATGQKLTDAGALHLFRRVVGSVVLYEVTPFEKPLLIDLFYIPDRSPKMPRKLSR